MENEPEELKSLKVLSIINPKDLEGPIDEEELDDLYLYSVSDDGTIGTFPVLTPVGSEGVVFMQEDKSIDEDTFSCFSALTDEDGLGEILVTSVQEGFASYSRERNMSGEWRDGSIHTQETGISGGIIFFCC